MEEELRSALLGDSGVVALAAQRVDWGVRPQGKGLPAITLTRVGGYRDRHLAGPSGLVDSRVQVECWAAEFKTARDLARAAEAVLGGFSGAVIKVAHVDSERSDFHATEAEKVHRTSLDLMVWHKQA